MDYIVLINYIKNNYSFNWLTNSQKNAYNILKEYLIYDDVINLYGKRGVGKTFLGWVFAKNNNFIYFENEDAFRNYKVKTKINAIIDNGSLKDGREIRRMVSLKTNKVIYISRKKILDYGIELKLDLNDVEHVLNNLSPIIGENINTNIQNLKINDIDLWNIFKGRVYEY
ncbi:hypothetical protein ACPB8Q_06480 [Methanocaldococcus indicus]|uniref:hypothetical protein n=1 Tax=Methanocaldococcus indicus TaxID=213231 RepID=UPI003C6D1D0C